MEVLVEVMEETGQVETLEMLRNMLRPRLKMQEMEEMGQEEMEEIKEEMVDMGSGETAENKF